MSGRRIKPGEAVLVIIDVQENLMAVIDGREAVEQNVVRLIRGCHLLGLPAVVTEQYPKGLGPTVENVRRSLADTYRIEPIQKRCFSSYQCTGFIDALAALRRKQVLVAGVEAHVCVHQTVLDLLDAGFRVTVVADAVSSRTSRNRKIALHRMESEGAKLSSTEMVLFELTFTSEAGQFKAISELVK